MKNLGNLEAKLLPFTSHLLSFLQFGFHSLHPPKIANLKANPQVTSNELDLIF